MGKIQLLFSGIYTGLGKFGSIVSSIINLIFLFIVFVLGIGVVSLIAKLVGKKFLTIKMDKKLNTYWQDTIMTKRKKEDYYKPF